MTTQKTYRCKICHRKMAVTELRYFLHKDNCMVKGMFNNKDFEDYFQRVYEPTTVIIRGVK